MRAFPAACLGLAIAALLGACGRIAQAEPPAREPAGLEVAANTISHTLRPAHPRADDPAAEAEDLYHRFRIPVAATRVAYVDLHYRTPLVEALGEHTLVINGGYWAYAGRRRIIQGLLMVDGKRIAPLVRRASGGVLSLRAGRAELTAAEDWQVESAAELALQCKPRLVSQGRLIPKLDAQRRAARTALCIRDAGKTLDAYLSDALLRPTLAELAAFLLAEGCSDALNLDGGPSTAAVFRRAGEPPLTVGAGFELPYGLGFSPR